MTLLCDRDHWFREALADLLRGDGWLVRASARFEAGMANDPLVAAVIGHAPPAFETRRIIEALHHRQPTLPVVVLTADWLPGVPDSIVRRAHVLVRVKPLDYAEFRTCLAGLVAQARARRPLR